MTNNAISESQVLHNFLLQYDVNEKKVLEVGGVINENDIKEIKVKWTSVDPLYTPLEKYELINSDKILGNKVKHIKEDITTVSFRENEFDYIFSCNAFQHINDLAKAFSNFYKWLNKDGILYSHFGPIWSAPDGCHIEGLEYNGMIYNFWEHKLVPYWSHLVFSQQEMQAFLDVFYPSDFTTKIVRAIYESNWINRFKFSDYKKLIKDPRWEIINFSYSKDFDYIPKKFKNNIDFSNEEHFFKTLSNILSENFVARDLLIIIKKR